MTISRTCFLSTKRVDKPITNRQPQKLNKRTFENSTDNRKTQDVSQLSYILFYLLSDIQRAILFRFNIVSGIFDATVEMDGTFDATVEMDGIFWCYCWFLFQYVLSYYWSLFLFLPFLFCYWCVEKIFLMDSYFIFYFYCPGFSPSLYWFSWTECWRI